MRNFYEGTELRTVEEAGRFARIPAIQAPLSDAARSQLWESFESDDVLNPADLVDSEELEELEDLVGGSQGPPSVEVADFGRGASGIGLVLEFVVEPLLYFGGVIEALRVSAWGIREAHKRISKRLGHAATISLGAAEYLAGADLIERLNPSELRLAGSGGIGLPSDQSFVGGDAFWIVFDTGDALHHYQVDSYGRVTYVGPGPHLMNWMDPPPDPPE